MGFNNKYVVNKGWAVSAFFASRYVANKTYSNSFGYTVVTLISVAIVPYNFNLLYSSWKNAESHIAVYIASYIAIVG